MLYINFSTDVIAGCKNHLVGYVGVFVLGTGVVTHSLVLFPNHSVEQIMW